MKLKSLKWSTNTVAAVYRSVVSHPFICPMNPGVGDSSWSMDMQSPGFWIMLVPPVFRGTALSLHDLRVALP